VAVVTISREHGAFGTEIGHLVAERLGGRYLDRELIDMALQFAGLHVPEASEPPAPPVPQQEVPGLARRILDAVTGPLSAGLQPWPRYAPPKQTAVGEEDSLLRQAVGTDDAYVAVMSQVLERIVEEQPHAVLVGRGGQCILGGRPGVLNVFVCGSLADRIQRVAEGEKLDRQDAASSVRAFDEERSRYIRRYFGADWQRPSLYHLTVNTSWLSIDQAVDLIVKAATFVERGA